MQTWILSLSEIMIPIFGLVSMLLINLNNKYSKYGILAGLLGQPFWIISTLHTKSWGIFINAIIYTVFFCVGMYNFWFNKKRINKRK